MRILMLAGALALGVTSTAAIAAKPSNVVVFGDSTVDSGNVFLATGGAIPAVADGYFQGRFQDGYNFADRLNIKFAGAPTLASLAGGNNWAWGGARGTGVGGFAVPGLPAQGFDFFTNGPRGFSSDSLVILNIGGNDVFGLQSGDTGGLAPEDFATLYINNMRSAVLALDGAGAGRILVMGIPNPTPTGFALNAQLQFMLDSIEPALGARLYRYDYFGFYQRLQADPTQYGIRADIDFSTPCLAVEQAVNGKIDCSGYFSFDGTHFTGQIHRAITRDLVQVLGVPEPATWGMMIAGFGLVGAALRRQRRVAAAA